MTTDAFAPEPTPAQTREARVLIPQVPTRFDKVAGRRVPSVDLNPAARYGEFTELSVDGGIEELRSRFAVEARANDYILCVGDVVMVAAAISYACDAFGKARLLRWDKNRKTYDTMEVEL